MKMIKSSLVLGLSALVVYFVTGTFTVYWNIPNWYEVGVLYLIFVFVPTIILFVLSLHLYKTTVDWQKNIAFIGIGTTLFAGGSFLLLLIQSFV